MKYYTRELYDQMQVSAYIGLNDIDDWDYLYDMVYREHKEITKKMIIKEVYKSNISEVDIEIVRDMPIKILNKLVKYNKEFKDSWTSVCNECHNYQSSIIKSFSSEVVQFLKKTVHDVNIYEICENGDKVDLIVGEGIDFLEYNDKFVITFHGVKEFELPGFENQDTCLYEEFDTSEIGMFEYRVLTTNSELRIVADSVEVKPRSNKTGD